MPARHLSRAWVLAAALTGVACGSSSPGGGAAGTSGGPGNDADASGGRGGGATGCPVDPFNGDGLGSDGGADDGGGCAVAVARHPEEGTRKHVACVPEPVYCTNPPSSGNHYPIWADFKTYDAPVPWGHLMHSMEHGAVIVVYNCPDGCPDEVAAAQAMIDALPTDPLCTAPTKHRVILAPDPKLTVRWAAAAWTWTLRATCFDAPTFHDFATAHYGMGGEVLCGELHEPFCDVGSSSGP